MALADKPVANAGGVVRCDPCDKHPSVMCPTCPRRTPDYRDRSDQGFRMLAKSDPEMARVQLRSAHAARALSLCHESHPAYPELVAEYQRAGVALSRLQAKRRGAPDPFPEVA